jgi:hypothetical protein
MADADKDRQAAAEQARATALLQQALRTPLPRFYANSFINALTDADVMTIFQANGQAVAIVNMNYTVAKSFVNALSQAIEEYEKKFDTKVPIIEFGLSKPTT